MLAQKSERIFGLVQDKANSINMKVNAAKTQMLCINSSNHNSVESYIRVRDGEEIISGQSLKILGFDFNDDPSATHHVTGVINKMYGKLWVLRFLKRSGMEKDQLMKVYKEVIRTSAEYSLSLIHI